MNPVPFHNSIQLKKLKLSDAEDLFPVFNDPDVVKYLPQTRHEDVNQTTDFLSFLLEEAKKGNSYIWKITDKQKEKDDAIGLIDLVSISKNGHTGSLAYVVRKSCWGKGVASYSVQQAIFYVFRQTVMRTVYAPVVSRNTASKHVLIKTDLNWTISNPSVLILTVRMILWKFSELTGKIFKNISMDIGYNRFNPGPSSGLILSFLL